MQKHVNTAVCHANQCKLCIPLNPAWRLYSRRFMARLVGSLTLLGRHLRRVWLIPSVGLDTWTLQGSVSPPPLPFRALQACWGGTPSGIGTGERRTRERRVLSCRFGILARAASWCRM